MERKDNKEVLKELWMRYKGVLVILTAGVVLLSWPAQKPTEADIAAGQSAGLETPEETEARMERILERIDGVGQVKLMLTLENGIRQELAEDRELSYRGDGAAPEEYSRQSETVIVSDGQRDSPVVMYHIGPVYRGAVVVCQGAENAGVRLAVTKAVAALTGLSSDRIVVIKCQS